MAWAVVVGAVIGLAGTAYSAYDAKEKQKEVDSKQEEAEAETKALEKLSRKNSVADKGATVSFGDRNKEIGSYEDFITPVDKSKGKPSLGFGTGSGLVT